MMFKDVNLKSLFLIKVLFENDSLKHYFLFEFFFYLKTHPFKNIFFSFIPFDKTAFFFKDALKKKNWKKTSEKKTFKKKKSFQKDFIFHDFKKILL